MKFLDVLMRMTVGGQFVLKPTGSLSDFGQVEFLHCKKVETCNCYFKKLVPQYLTKKKKKKVLLVQINVYTVCWFSDIK